MQIRELGKFKKRYASVEEMLAEQARMREVLIDPANNDTSFEKLSSRHNFSVKLLIRYAREHNLFGTRRNLASPNGPKRVQILEGLRHPDNQGRHIKELRKEWHTSMDAIKAVCDEEKIILDECRIPLSAGSEARIAQVRALASEGKNADQMAQALGLSRSHLMRLARAGGIEVPSIRKTSRGNVDNTEIIEQMVMQLDACAAGLRMEGGVSLVDVSRDDAERMELTLTSAMSEFRKLQTKLRNRANVQNPEL